MSLERFITEAISPWMRKPGPDTDIVLSSRIRLARNLDNYTYPLFASSEEAEKVVEHISEHVLKDDHGSIGQFELIKMNDLSSLAKRVLVEKHLISPHLAEQSQHGAVLLSKDESISMMINEEDHLRIQCLYSGFQLNEALAVANGVDDWLEAKFTFAFDTQHGYLTSCPTNVGTGLRASVMMHLPALVMTQQLTRIVPAINQLGLVVRGIYGEGSEALGNLFQISNQITLGKSEQDIVEDLHGVVSQLIQQERSARKMLMDNSRLQLEDRVCRSFGILAHARMIESKEAAQKLSDVRLGIDLGIIEGVSGSILNELMILTQPAFLQQYSKEVLSAQARDERRAQFIRERLRLEK